MRRRQLLNYASATFLGTLGLGIASNWQSSQAQSGGSLTIKSLGHMCFLFTGSGRRILSNPFRPIGCTEGYRSPITAADLVLVSSRLFDEGFIEGYEDVELLDSPGVYDFNGFAVQGIGMDHDREGGRRFGDNTAWEWTQGGVKVVNLGGAAAPISLEDKILIGRPDVLLVPVGGGPKAYTPEEAAQAVQTLNPKLVIPTQYRTQAADDEFCDIVALDAFLSLMAGVPVSRPGDTITVSAGSLSSSMRIAVLNYRF